MQSHFIISQMAWFNVYSVTNHLWYDVPRHFIYKYIGTVSYKSCNGLPWLTEMIRKQKILIDHINLVHLYQKTVIKIFKREK